MKLMENDRNEKVFLHPRCVTPGLTLNIFNIYCIILFITVVAFNKKTVRDIAQANRLSYYIPNLHELFEPFLWR